MSAIASLTTFAVLLCVTARLEAANILLIPFLNQSHFFEMDGVGKPLAERGHNVYLLLNGRTTLQKNTHYKVLTYKGSELVDFSFGKEVQNKFFEDESGESIQMMLGFLKEYCNNMLGDSELFPRLRELKFDLAIVDNFYLKCLYLIPYELGIPFVSMGTPLTAWHSRLPVLPSVVQQPIGLEAFGFHFCEETPNQWKVIRSFCRLGSFLAQEYFLGAVEEDYLRQYVDFPSIQEIRENASLTLFNLNLLLLGSPLPKLPNVEYVGGLTTRPGKPLPDDLEKWMSEAPNVVVVSFGGSYSILPSSVATRIFDAFAQLPKYRFLYRYDKEESKAYNIPANVRLMDWLPQNDALAHKNTRLFITHSGNNGLQEALYHGVPMLCFYVHGDQKYNAKTAVKQGFGLDINFREFTAADIVARVTELMTNQSYSARIKKVSAIFHSEKHPAERAADAVEHVLKYGGDHLRPKESYKLKWWQFYMLDVLFIIYASFLLVAYISFKLLKCTIMAICCRQRKARVGKSKSD